MAPGVSCFAVRGLCCKTARAPSSARRRRRCGRWACPARGPAGCGAGSARRGGPCRSSGRSAPVAAAHRRGRSPCGVIGATDHACAQRAARQASLEQLQVRDQLCYMSNDRNTAGHTSSFGDIPGCHSPFSRAGPLLSSVGCATPAQCRAWGHAACLATMGLSDVICGSDEVSSD